MQFQVQWEYREMNGQFQPYPAEINTKLEKAYSNKESSVEWEEEEEDNDDNTVSVTCVVDFGRMEETGDQTVKKVHRKEISKEGKGKHFSFFSMWTDLTLRCLSQTTKEKYKHLITEIPFMYIYNTTVIYWEMGHDNLLILWFL